MSALPKNSPIYQDILVAWHNQRLWWLLCGAGAIIAALTAVLCVVLLRPHSQPWVVEVNSKGEPIAGVEPLAGSQAISDTTIRWAIGEYIQNAFRISSNFDEEKTLLSSVYGMSTTQASKALTAYYRANKDANNPLVVGSKCWQTVRVVRTLKLPAKDVYQVDYTLFRHDDDHPLIAGPVSPWRATMRVVQGRPTDNNPLGIYFDDLDFQPEAKQ